MLSSPPLAPNSAFGGESRTCDSASCSSPCNLYRPMDSACPLPPTHPRFGQIPLPHPRGCGGAAAHRRANSETVLCLPDNLLLEPDPDFEIPDIDFSSLSDDTISGDSGGAAEPVRPNPLAAAGKPTPGAHLRSLSVDAAFFEGLMFQGADPGDGVERRGNHRRSGSIDGATSPFEGESGPFLSDFSKKVMPADKLTELALIDPKRAKRILANRQSAARSKERKIHYTSELERKVQMLQLEATSLSAKLTLMQKDSGGLTAENRELKLRLQDMEQQSKLREALNDTLREEVQRLKQANEQLQFPSGNPFNMSMQQTPPSIYADAQQLSHRSNQAQHVHASPVQLSSNERSPNCQDDPME